MLKNNDKVFKKIKDKKIGGHKISYIFKVFRHSLELAVAGVHRGFRFSDRKLKISLTEIFIDEYTQYRYRFSVFAGHYVSEDEWKDYGTKYFNNFEDANKYFIEIVERHNMESKVNFVDRYVDYINNNVKKFNYLSFLVEESRKLK